MALRYPGLTWLIRWWLYGAGVAFPASVGKVDLIAESSAWYRATYGASNYVNEMIYRFLLDQYNAPPVDMGYYQTILTDNPISYWRFAELSGLAAFDAVVATSNVGTYTAGVTHGIAGAIADGNPAVGLPAAQDISIPILAAYQLAAGPFSVELFVKRNGNPAGEVGIFSTYDGSTEFSLGINLTPAGVIAVYRSDVAGPGLAMVGSTVVTDNQWHQIVVTLSGGSVNLFIDGAGDTAGANPGNGGTRPIVVGSENHASFLGGAVDELSIFDYKLTPAQILAHFVARLVP